MQSGTWSQSGIHVNLVNVHLLSSFWKWNQSGEMYNLVIQIGWPTRFEASGQRLPDCILQSGKGNRQIEDQSGKARFARLHFAIWLHRKQSGNLEKQSGQITFAWTEGTQKKRYFCNFEGASRTKKQIDKDTLLSSGAQDCQKNESNDTLVTSRAQVA